MISKIWTSNLGRSVETAQIFRNVLLEAGANPPAIQKTRALQSYRLGGHEGRKLDRSMQDEIHRLMRDAPDEIPPGRGPKSTEDGESFNQFRERGLSFVHEQMEDHFGKTIEFNFTHRYLIQLTKAHVGVGAKDDLSIDLQSMMNYDDSLDHDSTWRLWKSISGVWKFDEVEMAGCSKCWQNGRMRGSAAGGP